MLCLDHGSVQGPTLPALPKRGSIVLWLAVATGWDPWPLPILLSLQRCS